MPCPSCARGAPGRRAQPRVCSLQREQHAPIGVAAPPRPARSLTNYAAAAPGGLGGAADANHTLTVATRNLFQSLTRSAQPVPPMEFILTLRKSYPQFAQTSRRVAGRGPWGGAGGSGGAGGQEARRAPPCPARVQPPPPILCCPAAGRATTCSRMRTSAGPPCWWRCATSSRCAAVRAVRCALRGCDVCVAPAAHAGQHHLVIPAFIPGAALTLPSPNRLPRPEQDGPSGDPVIRKLFGVRMHKSLKAEEGEETVEVRFGWKEGREAGRQERLQWRVRGCAAEGAGRAHATSPRPPCLPAPPHPTPPHPTAAPLCHRRTRWWRSWCATSTWK